MNVVKISVGDILTMKKPHPCSCYDFEVLRTGSDIRIKCIKCGRDMAVNRLKLEPSIKLVNGKNKLLSDKNAKGEN